jgi:hypothetical protein
MEQSAKRDIKTLKRLKNNYIMYENTKKETSKRLKHAVNQDGTKKYSEEEIQNNLKLISNAEQDIVEQFKMAGGKMEELDPKVDIQEDATVSATNNPMPTPIKEKAEDVYRSIDEERKKILDEQISATATKIEQEYIPTKGNYNAEEAFDVIKLPSKGEGYKEKISRVSVAYLTAYDENMIVSPNLYRDNLILDYIVQEKLLSKEIDPLDLLEGDRDAIILFLRANGYGNEYPITAIDDVTGKEFEAIVDLSKLNYKEFNLVGDSNGWFPFTLPVSKKEIKFRFPTHRDIILLDKMQEAEEPKIMKETLKNYVNTLDSYVEKENKLERDEKIKVRQAIRTLEKWGDDMEEENSLKFNHTLTNRLNLLIMAVDGITDREYISNFIRKMNVRDSSALRKYMTKNEPGIDYNITVQRPEELGGGSMTTFLQLDKFLFLNIAD